MIQRFEMYVACARRAGVALACAAVACTMAACIGGVYGLYGGREPGDAGGAAPRGEASRPDARIVEEPFGFYNLVTGKSANLVRAEGLGLSRDAVIFYEHEFGRYPRIFQGRTEHGGVPQLGDLNAHLREVRADIERQIPDPAWSGLAVIDYESRPVLWREMRNDYKDLSRGIVRQNNPELTDDEINAEAKRQYEEANRRWYTTTIELAKALRPNAQWGYFAVPTSRDTAELDRLDWLIERSDALYTAIYARKYGVRGTPSTKDEADYNDLARTMARGGNFTRGLIEADDTGTRRYLIIRAAYDDVAGEYRDRPLNADDARTLVVGGFEEGWEGVLIWDFAPNPTRAGEINRAINGLAPLVREVRERDARERAERQREQAAGIGEPPID